MNSRLKVYGTLLFAAALAGGVVIAKKYAWWSGTASANQGQPPPGGAPVKEAVVVELSPALRGPISSFIFSSGNLRPLREVEVAAQQDGIIREVNSEEGMYVEAGQTLAQIDDSPFRIRVALAQSKLEQARLQHEKAKLRLEKNSVTETNRRIEFERYEKAFAQGVASQVDVAQRKAALDELVQDGRIAQSEIRESTHKVSELEAEIAQAKLDIAHAQVKAPFAGFVTKRSVELGQRVRNLEAVFTLGAFRPLFVDIFVPERNSLSVRPGQAAEIRPGADDPSGTAARVLRIAPVVDNTSGTVKVTVELDGRRAELRPGAFVRVAIRTDTKADAILIPRKAVLEEDGRHYVFIAEGDSVKRVGVETGYESDTQVEIKSGLTPGQRVVTAGQGALKEGSKIKVPNA